MASATCHLITPVYLLNDIHRTVSAEYMNVTDDRQTEKCVEIGKIACAAVAFRLKCCSIKKLNANSFVSIKFRNETKTEPTFWFRERRYEGFYRNGLQFEAQDFFKRLNRNFIVAAVQIQDINRHQQKRAGRWSASSLSTGRVHRARWRR